MEENRSSEGYICSGTQNLQTFWNKFN